VSPSSVEEAPSSLTSMSENLEPEGKICRCKSHTDECDRLQFTSRAEKCVSCRGYFSWSAKALSFILLRRGNGFLCCCNWHGRNCRKLQEDYDARKCDCCQGWLPFSEQANNLIRPCPSKDSHGPAGDQTYFSEFINLG
jgi:hypothetical protein